MHIGSQLVDIDPDREKELNPSVGLEAIRLPQFPNADAEADFWREAQRAIDRQAHAWAVAPRCEIRAPKSGLLLSAGAEVVPGRDATIGQIHTLHRRGVILRGTPEGQRVAACPSDARYRVAPNQAIISLEGQLLSGAEVRAEYLAGGEQDLLALVHRGVVIDRARPALSQAPAAVALREREADLERAQADVDAAVEALTAEDNAKTQKNYVDKKLQLDLAGVRVEAARKAVEAAKAAEAARQQLELARKVQDLEAKIKEREAKTSALRAAEIKAAIALADAFHATHAHEDGMYQLAIQRNARFAELHGGEMREENPPGIKIGLIPALARLVGIDPKHLNEKNP